MGQPSFAFRVGVIACASLPGLLALGCRNAEGKRYGCACRFLTDYDDLSTRSIELCARPAGPIDIAEQARGCAQSASPGPVQSCECTVVASAAPCKVGDCRGHD